MSAKLDKIGADLKRARAKWKQWEDRTHELEEKYAEQENAEICEVTHSYNLTPDQLAMLLELTRNAAPESAAAREALGALAENADEGEGDGAAEKPGDNDRDNDEEDNDENAEFENFEG